MFALKLLPDESVIEACIMCDKDRAFKQPQEIILDLPENRRAMEVFVRDAGQAFYVTGDSPFRVDERRRLLGQLPFAYPKDRHLYDAVINGADS